MKRLSAIGILFIGFFVCIIMFLSFPATAQSDEESKATVDDLFQFLVDEWANKNNLSMKEASVITGQAIVGLPIESNFKEVLLEFAGKVIESENTFAHIPEYWQLRAHLERESGIDWIKEPTKNNMTIIFANRLDGDWLNHEALEKSLEIESSNGEVFWYIHKIKVEEKFPDHPNWNNPDDPDVLEEYCKLTVEYHTDAAEMNPQNAFYPFYEAVYYHKLGKKDKAMNALKRAAECEHFYFPRIFPSNYALSHITEFESGKEPFDEMTPGGKYYLFMSFFDGADSLPNYIHIKNLYKDIIADSHDQDEWSETLNILHRAACVLGKGEGKEPVNYLVAVVMIKLCMIEGLRHAEDSQDTDLEKAIIAAFGKTRYPKILSSARLINDNMMWTFLYSVFIDQMNQLLDPETPYITLSMFLPPTLEMRYQWQVFEKHVKPVFEELETFDYANPSEWYDKWIIDSFPELFKVEEK